MQRAQASSLVLILTAVLGLIVAAPVAQATVYNVGPGKTYATIGAVPWISLQPGDTINIYYQATPYYEKVDIGVVGTAANPVVIQGIPDGSGNLPIIDGQNAVTSSQFSFGSQPRGIFAMQPGTTQPPACNSAYVTIKNLEIRNASTPYTFKGYAGDTQSYTANAAAIWMVDGQHINIQNCYIHDCGNGIMTYCADSGVNQGITNWTQDFLIEGNYITNCGNPGSTQEHDTYTETYRVTYQYNRFGPPRGTLTGQAIGNALKDRSAGCVIRYNWIDGGNRETDLVECQDSATLYSEPEYANTFVYGNVLIKEQDSGNNEMAHWGYDNKNKASWRRPYAYYYNNTFVSLRTGATVIFDSTGQYYLDCRNNIIDTTAGGTLCTLVNSSSAPVNISHNWLKPGYVKVGSSGGTVNDDATTVTGTSAGFINESGQDYHLTAASQCLNAATTLHTACSGNPVTMQYLAPGSGETRPNGNNDIGAFGYSGALAIVTSSLPAGTINAAYSQTLVANGGTTPYGWFVSSGSLPAGLSLNTSSGAITGTPTATGTSSFTAEVSDNVGATATKALSIAINPPAPLSITTTSLPGAHKGLAYSATLAATGGVTPYAWSIMSGSLPAGLSLTGSSGLISGTPTVSGTSNFTAKVTDNVSATATKALSIAVARH